MKKLFFLLSFVAFATQIFAQTDSLPTFKTFWVSGDGGFSIVAAPINLLNPQKVADGDTTWCRYDAVQLGAGKDTVDQFTLVTKAFPVGTDSTKMSFIAFNGEMDWTSTKAAFFLPRPLPRENTFHTAAALSERKVTWSHRVFINNEKTTWHRTPASYSFEW